MIYSSLGFLAGLVHTLSGPDHLSAVAPLSVENRKRAWEIGFSWGLGHSTGLVIVALLVFLLRNSGIPKLLSMYSEWLVGVILIAIGLRSFLTVFPIRIHSHKHTHNDETHEHFHSHVSPRERHEELMHTHTHAIYGVGILHGISGGSHFIAVVPALALPTTASAFAYVVGFIAGTIIAMVGFSTALGALSTRLSLRRSLAYKALILGSGLTAIFVGVIWLVP